MEFSGQHSYGGQLGYNSAPTPLQAEAPEASRVRDGVTSAEQALSTIHEEISRLEKRLETVLRPMPPQGNIATQNAQAGPVCSHVTGRLNILNDGFQHAVARLRELTGRVEV